jgi:hypothetical protein
MTEGFIAAFPACDIRFPAPKNNHNPVRAI